MPGTKRVAAYRTAAGPGPAALTSWLHEDTEHAWFRLHLIFALRYWQSGRGQAGRRTARL